VKKYSDTADIYIDPDTGTLKNKLGIKSVARLERAEVAAVSVRQEELLENPVQGNFDFAHLQAIHKKLFGDVYDWAGEIRAVDISKGQSRFAHYGFIEKEFKKLTASLNNENNLRNLPPEQFCARVAHYMGEMNVIHPFREGNGRALRVLVGQLAQEAGYEIKWEGITQQEMLQASIAAYQGSSDYLAKLISDNIVELKNDKTIDRPKADKTLWESIQPDGVNAVTAGDSLLHQAEQSASEQRALLENASLEQTLTATLKPYVEAKHEQIERIEAKLGQVIEQQQTKLNQVEQNPPKHKWLSSKKTKAANTNAWYNNKNKQLARLHELNYRKSRVEKIKESTDSRFPTIDQLATQKMRREHPELAASWNAMRESVRLKQQQERQQREKQAQSQEQSQLQGYSLSLGHRLRP